MGSCTAYQVAKQGSAVLLLEHFDVLHRRGSSHRKTRTTRVAYPKPYYTHTRTYPRTRMHTHAASERQRKKEGEREMGVSGEYEVVVVGAGIMGTCTAYQVAKQGSSVLLLEKFDFLHRLGSSHGESRTTRVAYTKPYYTHMMKEAFSLWSEAQEEAGYKVHTPTPWLDFGPASRSRLQGVLSCCKLHSVQAEVLSVKEASARFPAFSFPERDFMAIVTQQSGIIHATKAVAMFHALALKHGAILCDRTPVTSIDIRNVRMSDGRDAVRITTDQGSVVARKCVIAAGAWTGKLVKELCGIELPIQPLHTTLAYWQIKDEAAKEFTVASGFPSFAHHNEPYIYGNASIELPGLIKVTWDSGYVCDPDKRSLAPDWKALKDHVSPWLEKHFKGKVKSDTPVVAEACTYSMTPDRDFIIDFLPMGEPGENRIVVAGGFSGHGFKMGPLVGKIVADLCLKGSCENVPLEYFSIARFSRNPKGNAKS